MAKGKYLFIVTLFACSVCAEVPFITKCLSTDASCVKMAAQAALPILVSGIPEMKVQPLDPLVISELDASSKQLKFTSTDVVMTGLKDCIIDKIERSIEKSKLVVSALCDLEYNGKYEVNGRVLVVPFEGKGDIRVLLRKLYITVDSDVIVKNNKKGEKHWFIKNYKYSYELRDKSQLDLTGLFQGNEVLGRAARDLLKTSGNEIIDEVGPPILKIIVERIIKSINQLFRAVPEEDLALDPFKAD